MPAVNTTSKNPPATVAVIREDECIGCTRCIAACPVDAIIGAAKLMHTVISARCTGCDLCLEPCPVDCIDMAPVTATAAVSAPAREARAAAEKVEPLPAGAFSREQARREIAAAVARVRARRQRGENG